MSTTEGKRYRIVELRAENVKRLKAVRIRPNQPVTVLAGGNAQGKSSVLDALIFVLAGKRQGDLQLVRDGAKKASVTLELDDIVITRTRTQAGSETLTIRPTDPAKGGDFRSPQAFLDSITKRQCFDPLAFLRMEEKEQTETLRKLLGFDFTELDETAKVIYTERTEWNREIDSLKIRVAQMPVYPDAKEPLSTDALEAQLSASDQVAVEANQRRQQAMAARVQVERAEHTLADLRKQIEELEARFTRGVAYIKQAEELAQQQEQAAKEAEARVVPTASLVEKLREIRTHNEHVKSNLERGTMLEMLSDAHRESEERSRKLREIEETKQKKLRESAFPIEGLSFKDGRVFWQGVPLRQASGAEQLRISVAVSAAMNPSLPAMCIKDASILDDYSMQLVFDLAAERDLQVFMERVEKDQWATLIIEDGEVADGDRSTGQGQAAGPA